MNEENDYGTPGDGIHRAMEMHNTHVRRLAFAESARLEAEGQVFVNMGFTPDELTVLYRFGQEPQVVPKSALQT